MTAGNVHYDPKCGRPFTICEYGAADGLTSLGIMTSIIGEYCLLGNIDLSYQYRKSHCGDKTIIRSSYLHNRISCTGEVAPLYWANPWISYNYTIYILIYNMEKLVILSPKALKHLFNMRVCLFEEWRFGHDHVSLSLKYGLTIFSRLYLLCLFQM